jgi:hypothetical protein
MKISRMKLEGRGDSAGVAGTLLSGFDVDIFTFLYL